MADQLSAIRRTKIVATIGPASAAPDVLSRMLAAGVDVFRLNFSHGTHDSHRATALAIREAAKVAGRHVAVMQDLSGPKIRTGALAGGTPLELEPGAILRIAAGEGVGSGDRVFTAYTPLVESARAGDRLLLDDGRIELRVTESRKGEIVTEVVNGGTLAQNKGINAPGVALPSSAVTDKDADDLRFGLEIGVDLVALSFVQTAADVLRAIEIMKQSGRRVPVIAKIERPAGVDNLDEIVKVAQGIMVARGDLGLEMPLEQVPRVQKIVIREARVAGLPVILATQVLESMRTEPRPTRAEVSDAATAVDEGADAIMLAGETAAGKFPVRAVEVLDAIIRDAERVRPEQRLVPLGDAIGSRHGRALCEAALTLAETARADAIIAVTRENKTARLLSSLRPTTPVFAATPQPEIARRGALLWGISPIVTPSRELVEIQSLLVEQGLAQPGSVVVFVNVSPELDRPDANFVNVQKIA